MSDCVQSLHKSEQWEVYRILHAAGLKHTGNKYGVFFDVTNAADEVLSRVQSFIEFTEESRKYLTSAETVIDSFAAGHGPGAIYGESYGAAGSCRGPGGAAIGGEAICGDAESFDGAGDGPGIADGCADGECADGADGADGECAEGAEADGGIDADPNAASHSDAVQSFIQSMIRLRDENPALKRRETSRFQAYRKKYSRHITQKTCAPCAQPLQEEDF
jgi:hypothetical protein